MGNHLCLSRSDTSREVGGTVRDQEQGKETKGQEGGVQDCAFVSDTFVKYTGVLMICLLHDGREMDFALKSSSIWAKLVSTYRILGTDLWMLAFHVHPYHE
jgi:hypothetical protein